LAALDDGIAHTSVSIVVAKSTHTEKTDTNVHGNRSFHQPLQYWSSWGGVSGPPRTMGRHVHFRFLSLVRSRV